MEDVGVKDTHLWVPEGCCKEEGLGLFSLHPQFRTRINEESCRKVDVSKYYTGVTFSQLDLSKMK